MAALEWTPEHLPALRGRRRMAEAQNEQEIALDCIRREGELTQDTERATELLTEREELGAARQAKLQAAARNARSNAREKARKKSKRAAKARKKNRKK